MSDHDEEEQHVETIAIEPDGGLDGLPAPSPPPSDQPPSSPRHHPLRLSFFRKVSIHLTGIIVMCGFLLTVAVTWQLQRLLQNEEHYAVLSVYTAASNYIAAHLQSHKGQPSPKHLDFVFSHRFMRLEEIGHVPPPELSHRPIQIVLYSTSGSVLFEHRADDSVSQATSIPGDQLPAQYTQGYNPDEDTTFVIGPITPNHELMAYLKVVFPSVVKNRSTALYLKMAAVTILVVCLAVGISLLFVRRELKPIKILTNAATAIRKGDLNQRVAIHTDDEIGDLARTFNRMVESVSSRISLMNHMQRIVVQIGRQLDNQQLYEILVDAFTALADAPGCRIYIFDESNNTMEVVAERGGEHLPPSAEDWLTEQTHKERWTQFLTLGGKHSTESEQAAELAIPLLSGTHRIGVARIGKKKDATTHGEESLATLNTLAQFASVAIENAGLYSQLSEQQRIEQEMVWAHNIQQSMLPNVTPALTGYDLYGASTPANEVGGDYFDYVFSQDGGLHIVIADVSGKGVPAAMIMSIVRSLIHTYLEFENAPVAVLQSVNRSLSADLESDMFVTLSSLQVTEKGLRLARAGHEPAIVLRNNGRIQHISPPGAALGLLDVDDFHRIIRQEQFELCPGEKLILYTDGITEAMNAEREEFGQERLEAILVQNPQHTARQLYDAVMNAVATFSRGVPQNDDITLVVLTRTDETD